jgi:hypothetical protein
MVRVVSITTKKRRKDDPWGSLVVVLHRRGVATNVIPNRAPKSVLIGRYAHLL